MLSGGAGDQLVVAGRVMLAFVFVYGAFRRQFWLHKMAVAMLTRRGLPAAEPLLYLATTFQVVAGVLLALGLWLLPVVASLIAFTLLASVLMLDFWNKQGPERMAAESGWQSNVGIVGGLLVVAAIALR